MKGTGKNRGLTPSLKTTSDFQIALEGVFPASIVLKGQASNGHIFWGTNSAGSPTFETQADSLLQNERVDFFNPLSIQWSYAVPGRTDFIDAGLSTNQVYVTLRAPQTPNLLHTIVHHACSNPGATTDDMAVANTWTLFMGRTATTWNSRPMFYYKEGTPASEAEVTIDQMLSRTNLNGQCGAWCQLLGFAWQVNGISDWTWWEVKPPPDAAYFLIKNWSFAEPDTNQVHFQWYYTFNVTGAGDPEMVPSDGLGGTMSPKPGKAGQNSATPSEKVFGHHYVLKHAEKYYDPSYGDWYSGPADFQSTAVEAFGKVLLRPDPNLVTLGIRKPIAGLDGITFVPAY